MRRKGGIEHKQFPASEPERTVNGVYMPAGWTPSAWAGRLRYLADACEAINPARAAELREWAERISLTSG